VTIHLDTSALIDALTGPRRSLDRLIELVNASHRLALSSLVLYEWLRGPRTHAELQAQGDLFPPEAVVDFDAKMATVASRLYTAARKPRGREIDIAIAATAIAHGASLWTLNIKDFESIPDVTLV
jgi:hypothetical protein